ncbi:hypothetical protein [Actinopolyspora biskrensis]|uniref:phosphorylase family protein n=1 Tax=Actinopolyspora biskrensis TaxID=1470178 RepID=UPI0031B5E61A
MIEMEAAGVVQAGHLNDFPVAVVRGISDRADGTKTTDADGVWQPQAAVNAVAFAVGFAGEVVKERECVTMNEGNNPKNSAVIHNYVSGTVGIQGQHVTGNTVSMGAEPQVSTTAGPATELAAFRDHLRQQHSTGELDQVTYEAVEAELDIVSRAPKEDTQADKSTFVLALKRVRAD